MATEKERKFENDFEYRIYRILHLAKKYSWHILKSDQEKVEFSNREKSVLTINYKNLDINTILDHPKWGKTTLKREGKLTHKIIESIFRNPRAHMPRKARIKSSYQTP